jgi:WD40 repeat protein/tetratricopeptide (TPR) repeat protein
MDGCPTKAQLESFLSGSLGGSEEEWICGHVDRCTVCQGALESLVNSAASVSAPKPDEPLPDESILARLKAEPPPGEWRNSRFGIASNLAARVRATASAHHGGLPEIPGYEVLEEIGCGGMGVVYKAKQLGLNRLTAVKMIFAGTSASGLLNRFRAEAEAVAALHHPNIIQIYEVGSHKGTPFFSMEYASKGTLRTQLKNNGGSPRELAALIATLARAIQYAHECGIVHRDLKPANVLLSADNTPKIADFGLAKRIDDDGQLTQTQTGQILGTPSYMAPEQAAGKGNRAGPGVDIYALGAILYELLTGRPPFVGESFETTLNLILNSEPVAPRRLQPALPRDIETVCLKCLEKDPRRRYATAGALADDLDRFVAGQPVRVRPVGAMERGWRWCRRNPVVAALGSGFVATLLLGLAGVSWKWQEAESEKKKVVAADQKTKDERDQSKRLTAGTLLDKGCDLAEKGNVAEGLFWMLEALKAAPEDDRGLKRVASLNLAAWLPQAHGLRQAIPGDFRCVAISPDGRRLVTGSYTGELQFWDTETAQAHGQAIKLPGGYVISVAFSHDSAFCLASDGNSVHRFDVATATRVGTELRHNDFVHAAVFNPAGTRVATACEDGVVRLWEADSGKSLGEAFRDEKTHPVCLAFSTDGNRLAVGTARSYETSGTRRRAGRSLNMDPAAAHIIELSTGKRLGVALPHSGMITQVAFNHDGSRVLTGSSDGTARLWDAHTGLPLGPPMPYAVELLSANFTPDGAVIAMGDGLGQVGGVRWWDTVTGRPIVGSLPRHRGRVNGLGFSADGRFLVTVSARSEGNAEVGEAAVRLWQVARPPVRAPLARTEYVGNPPRPARPVGETLFSPDGRTAVSWDVDGTVARLWDVRTGLPRGTPVRHPWPILTACFSPDGLRVAIASWDKPGPAGSSISGLCQVVDVSTGRVLSNLPHTNWVKSLAFTQDGSLLATGGYDRCVRLWEPGTGKQVGEPWRQRDIANGLAFSPDNRVLAVSHERADSRQKGTTVWEVASRKPHGPDIPYDSYHFSPNGRLLATGRSSNSVRVWDADTCAPVEPNLAVAHPAEWRVLFSPDGNRLLTDAFIGPAQLWDVATGRQFGLPMLYSHGVTARAFSPDSQFVLLGYADGTARLWDAITQKPVGPQLRHDAPVQAVAFTPDARTYLTCGAECAPRTHPIPEAEPDADLERMQLRLEVRTGLTMTDGGYITELGFPEWHVRRDKLVALEGSTESAYLGSTDEHTWHEACAHDAEAEGDACAALWHLDRLVKSSPNDWRLYARRARMHSSAGRFDQAETEYALAWLCGAREELLDWYDHLIVECERAGQLNVALWYVDRVIEAKPKSWQGYAVRAAVYDKLPGRAAARDADNDRAIELGADGPFLLKLGSDCARREQWDKAVRYFTRAQERGPSVVGWERHALALLRNGDVAGYSRLCRGLIGEAEKIADIGSANSVAWVFALAPGAVDDYERVVRMAALATPDIPGINTRRHASLNTLGAALYRAGRYREAIAILNESVASVGGKDAEPDWVFLAMAHQKLGNTAEAKQTLKQINVVDLESGPVDWSELELEILRREAEKLIRP